jgi:hypothetical protein
MRQFDVDIGRMMKPSLAGRSTLSRVGRVGAVIPGRMVADSLSRQGAPVSCGPSQYRIDSQTAGLMQTHRI